VDWRDEFHRLDRHRRHGTLGSARRDDAGRNVHLAQHPAAEDMAVGVDVARSRHHAQDGHALAIAHSCSLSSSIWGGSSYPLSALRKTSVINAVPSSTVRPAPSAVAMITWIGVRSPWVTKSTAIAAT